MRDVRTAKGGVYVRPFSIKKARPIKNMEHHVHQSFEQMINFRMVKFSKFKLISAPSLEQQLVSYCLSES